MTEEEARAEIEEANRLIQEINRLQGRISQAIIDNQNLRVELEVLIKNVIAVTQNAIAMDSAVNESMNYVTKRVQDADVNTAQLFALIDDLTTSYFIFKNLSTASKNLSQFTDEYYTRFLFFNELRRITLGYVIGLDAHVCSEETMRKKVEKAYLQNTEYWLAYAIMATMLWASDEEEAAKRALGKALSIDYLNTSLFFLLVNLRFTRIDAAKKWYLSYLDKVDINSLGSEWQYLLQAYLFGVFGADKEFQAVVEKFFTDMLESMESINPDYGRKVVFRTKEFAELYIHISGNEYENLRRNSTEYQDMKQLLSDAEKNQVLAVHFKKLLEDDTELETDLFQRIENILYSLINAYDKEEYKVVKNLKYNEMVLKAKGDLGMAQQYFNSVFVKDEKKSLDLLLFEWAFSEDERIDMSIKKFAITYLKKWICSGFQKFAEGYRAKEKEKYTIEIDGWKEECNENSYEEAKQSLEKHYNKNRVADTLNDKYVLIFSGMCLAALMILIMMISSFNKEALVIGILLGLAGGFLLWRRLVDMVDILRVKREKGYIILKNTLEDLKQWREAYRKADKKSTDLLEVFAEII